VAAEGGALRVAEQAVEARRRPHLEHALVVEVALGGRDDEAAAERFAHRREAAVLRLQLDEVADLDAAVEHVARHAAREDLAAP
jgi:hypothetical protein